MSLRQRLSRLEQYLGNRQPAILGATVAAGVVRTVLTADGIARPALPGLAVEDLPAD